MAAATNVPLAPTRRVRTPRDKQKLVEKLVEDKAFEYYRDVIAFAASLGVAKKQRTKLEAMGKDPIPWQYFTSAGLEALVNMIAVVETSDFNVLSANRFDERLTIFEEYANGGLQILEAHLNRSERPTLEVLLDLMMQAESEARPEPGVELERFAEDLAF